MIKNKLNFCMLLILVSCVKSEYKPRLLEQSSLPLMVCYDGVIYYEWGFEIAVKYEVQDGVAVISTCADHNKRIINNIGTDRE